MTEFQRLFLVQAQSDFAVFEFLRKQPNLRGCHALHYLQMATEKLGKAHAWRSGPRKKTHRAFVAFLRSLSTNRIAQKQLGFAGKNENGPAPYLVWKLNHQTREFGIRWGIVVLAVKEGLQAEHCD